MSVERSLFVGGMSCKHADCHTSIDSHEVDKASWTILLFSML